MIAGQALGLNRRISERELDRMTADMPQGLAALRQEIEAQNAEYPAPVRVFLGGELRLVRTVENVVLPFMLERLKP